MITMLFYFFSDFVGSLFSLQGLVAILYCFRRVTIVLLRYSGNCVV